jgi:hypothetical protein
MNADDYKHRSLQQKARPRRYLMKRSTRDRIEGTVVVIGKDQIIATVKIDIEGGTFISGGIIP